MKVLVTGGAGFIGSNLIKKLIKLNYQTISIDNYSTGYTSNHYEGCIYYNIDICDKQFFNDLPTDIDCIFHCAAKARIQESFIDPEIYFKSNVFGTYNVVNYALKINSPIIYTGTSSHHGGKFSNPYTFTKDIGEETILLHQKFFNLKASIARLYNVYGPNECTDKNATLIGKLKQHIKENSTLIINGNGNKKRDFTHVDDIVDGLVLIMQKEKYGYEFELGSGKNYSVNQIVSFFNYSNVIYKKDVIGEMKATLADNSLASQELSWKPKKSIIEYIEELKIN
jgi:UDP-glucose 4-epimerase